MLVTFTFPPGPKIIQKNSKRFFKGIQKYFPLDDFPKEFQRFSRGIPKDFPKESQRFSKGIPKYFPLEFQKIFQRNLKIFLLRIIKRFSETIPKKLLSKFLAEFEFVKFFHRNYFENYGSFVLKQSKNKFAQS